MSSVASQFRIGEAASERRPGLVDSHGSPHQSLAEGLLGPGHIGPIGEVGRYQGGAASAHLGMGRVGPLASPAAEPKRGRLARLSRRIRTCPPPTAQHPGVRHRSEHAWRLAPAATSSPTAWPPAASRRRWRSTTSAPRRARGSLASSSAPPARKRSETIWGARRHGGRRPPACGDGRDREAVQALRDRAVTGKVVLTLG
jgi:hypothetical protein